MTERFQTDGIAVTRDEAAELCIHHLQLAAKFFEVVAEPSTPRLLEELERLWPEDLGRPGAIAFIEAINHSYEEDKKRYD